MSTRVLVVEDDPSTCQMFEMLFGSDGYDVETVMDGAQALDRLDGPPVDLVVLDIMIPSADGIEVLTAMRARSDDWSSTPVIVATARGNDEDVWIGWRAGADYYLVKPFDPEELQSVARRLLTERAAPA